MENDKINSLSNKIYNIIFYAATIIIILVGLYYLINKTNIITPKYEELNTYTIQQIPKGNSSENMDMCKQGCVRGRCTHKNTNKNTKNGCKYDFQCNYCKDKETDQFYIDLTNYEELQPIYDEQKKISTSQTEDLNNIIQENNEYINELNDKIQDYNMN